MLRLMTKKEVALFLKVTEQTVDNYVRRGKLLPLRAESSNLVRFNADDVEKIFAPATDVCLTIKKDSLSKQ